MSFKNVKTTPFFASCLYILAAGFPVLADDIEIYTGDLSQSNVRPNVLFIMDTSGSMVSDVDITIDQAGLGPYAAGTTYAGDCHVDQVYWTTNGTPPSSCSNANYFLAANNQCNDSLSSLSTGGGYYVGRAARYKPGQSYNRHGGHSNRHHSSEDAQWDDLSTSTHNSDVDCLADWGNHGNGGAGLYPANEGDGGPWTTVEGDGINWAGTGQVYTFYSANYLNWLAGGGATGTTTTTTMTRLEVVQNVFGNLVDSTSGINASVMRFDSSGAGGYFLLPMQPVNSTTRQSFKDTVNALTPSGSTPLAETLYESALFYRGEAVVYGDSSHPGTNHTGVLKTADTTHYESPIDYQCQKNFTVLLTDGEPTSDTGANSAINTMRGASSCSGNCLDELSEYLYDHDQSDLNDTQNIITYTIGFQTNQQLLNDTARKGGGKYYTADDITGLNTAFTQILTEILEVNDTFTAPAVSVNAFNRLTHRNDLYFSLFRPALHPKWSGNIKRYILAGNPANITDVNDSAAIDANTGFFKSNSRSYWTLDADAPDGDDIAIGGSAGLLSDPGSRTMYTYTGTTAPSEVSLNTAAHLFTDGNTALNKDLLGITTEDDAYRTSLIQWSRGVDVKDEDEDASITDGRRSLGDPLHSKPTLVTYGGTNADPDLTLFASTNEGYLHAFNATTGAELFSFIPQELLPNLNTFFVNSGATHIYGLDGALTSWTKDVNGDNSIVSGDGDHVFLYVGMRRGGSNYYALDVTTRTAPKLKWMISGGSGDFDQLGQTWSKPIIGKIKLNDVDKDVLIFTGGYDPDQDTATTYQADDIGRAIYIVDADTGARLWWAGTASSGANLEITGLDNSIPATVQTLDMDLDGYTDRLYTVDIHGKVIRIDIKKVNTGAATLATGGIIAEFGGTTAAENRRFYYRPDVVLTKLAGRPQYMSVNVGSGYRAHPLNEVIHDEFYSFRDMYVYNTPASYTSITTTDLYDATANIIGTGSSEDSTAAINSLLDDKQGWKITLKKADGTWEGEKVQASALTYKGKVIFSTFTPVAAAQSTSCAPSQGTAKTYIVSLFDATAIKEDEIRFETMKKSGISPEAVVVFPTDTNGVATEPRIFIGQEDITGIGNLDKEVTKTNWIQTR